MASLSYQNSLLNARHYEELLEGKADPGPFAYETIFQGEGFFGRRCARRRFRCLQKIAPTLMKILHPQERVFYLTIGTTASWIEYYLVGWMALALNRRAIVFTTERILLLDVDGGFRPRFLVSQIRMERIASVSSSWRGICRLALQNGKTINFQNVPRSERRFLQSFLAEIVAPAPSPAGGDLAAPENLCPRCFEPVPDFPGSCPHCPTRFKSANLAAALSFLFPGLGNGYLGYRTHAVLESMGAAFFWTLFVFLPLLLEGEIDPETGETLVLSQEYWLGTALILLTVHLLDGAMTRHFGRKGLFARAPASANPLRP